MLGSGCLIVENAEKHQSWSWTVSSSAENRLRWPAIELDLRALALLRIAVACLILVDLTIRCSDLSAFFTDAGLLPRQTLLQIPHPTYLNLYLSIGTWSGAALLAGLEYLAAFCLLIGWRTRLAAMASWMLLLAINHRNPLILDAGDLELRLIAFWLIFLPVNARWSVDSFSAPEPDCTHCSSVATFGYLLQISLMYFMAGYNKSDPIWTQSGQALYYVCHLDEFSTSQARWALNYPEQLRILSFAGLYLEFLIPALLWFPWLRKPLRALACALIVCLHLGIASLMHLGLIAPINILVTSGLWFGPLLGLLERIWLASLGWLGSKITRLKSLPAKLPAGGGVYGLRLSKPLQVLLIGVCCYVPYINYAASVNTRIVVSGPVKIFGYLLEQHQDWMLFAPHPSTDDGWMVIQGTCLDGHQVDLLRDPKPLVWTKPDSIADEFKNQRWRRWTQNLGERNDPLVFKSYSVWLSRRWNQSHFGRDKVRHLKLVWISERTPAPGGEFKHVPYTLYEYDCPATEVNPANEFVIQ